MTARESFVLSLAGEQFTVRPLTLRQVEQIETVVTDGAAKSSVGMGIAVLNAALARDYTSELTKLPIDVGCLEATPDELATAMAAILANIGMKQVKPGEAQAAAATAPSGETSAEA